MTTTKPCRTPVDSPETAAPALSTPSPEIGGRPHVQDCSPAQNVKVPISDIEVHGDLQMREKTNEDVVAEYAERYRNDQPLPDLIVFKDTNGSALLLVDGFHRLAAAKEAGVHEIGVQIRTGSRRDALIFAAGVNLNHGLRRSNADKRRAVMVMLSDSEWSQRTDCAIAEHVGVTSRYVGMVRHDGDTLNNSMLQPIRKTRNGLQMKVKVGTKPKQAPTAEGEDSSCVITGPNPEPASEASLRDSSDNSGSGDLEEAVESRPVDVQVPAHAERAEDDEMAILRSTIIRMLVEGVRATGLDEGVLLTMDARTLADTALDAMSAQRSNSSQVPLEFEPGSSGIKALRQEAESLRVELTAVRDNAPGPFWTQACQLSQMAGFDQASGPKLKSYIQVVKALIPKCRSEMRAA